MSSTTTVTIEGLSFNLNTTHEDLSVILSIDITLTTKHRISATRQLLKDSYWVTGCEKCGKVKCVELDRVQEYPFVVGYDKCDKCGLELCRECSMNDLVSFLGNEESCVCCDTLCKTCILASEEYAIDPEYEDTFKCTRVHKRPPSFFVPFPEDDDPNGVSHIGSSSKEHTSLAEGNRATLDTKYDESAGLWYYHDNAPAVGSNGSISVVEDYSNGLCLDENY